MVLLPNGILLCLVVSLKKWIRSTKSFAVLESIGRTNNANKNVHRMKKNKSQAGFNSCEY